MPKRLSDCTRVAVAGLTIRYVFSSHPNNKQAALFESVYMLPCSRVARRLGGGFSSGSVFDSNRAIPLLYDNFVLKEPAIVSVRYRLGLNQKCKIFGIYHTVRSRQIVRCVPESRKYPK